VGIFFDGFAIKQDSGGIPAANLISRRLREAFVNRYADDADAADFRGYFSDLIRVDPQYPRHPRTY